MIITRPKNIIADVITKQNNRLKIRESERDLRYKQAKLSRSFPVTVKHQIIIT